MDTTKPTAYSKRRSPEQWQEIIQSWSESGLSTKDFCQQSNINYVSFSKWRRRLAEETSHIEELHNDTPSFINISDLASSEDTTWNIVLKLGNGVELCLSQQHASS